MPSETEAPSNERANEPQSSGVAVKTNAPNADEFKPEPLVQSDGPPIDQETWSRQTGARLPIWIVWTALALAVAALALVLMRLV